MSISFSNPSDGEKEIQVPMTNNADDYKSAEPRGDTQGLAQDEYFEQKKLTTIETKEKRMFDRDFEENGVRRILESLMEEEKEIMPDGNEPLRHFRAEKVTCIPFNLSPSSLYVVIDD